MEYLLPRLKGPFASADEAENEVAEDIATRLLAVGRVLNELCLASLSGAEGVFKVRVYGLTLELDPDSLSLISPVTRCQLLNV